MEQDCRIFISGHKIKDIVKQKDMQGQMELHQWRIQKNLRLSQRYWPQYLLPGLVDQGMRQTSHAKKS
jgi:hypothetical protein